MPEDQKSATPPTSNEPASLTVGPTPPSDSKLHLPKSRRLRFLMLALAIILVGLAIWLAFFKLGPANNSSSNQTQPLNYTYKTLSDFKAKSYPDPGGGIAVKKPIEQIPVKHPQDYGSVVADYIAADFTHTTAGKFIGSTSMLIDRSKKTPSADYLTNLQKALAADSGDTTYVNATKSVSGFVSTGVPKSWKLTLGQAAAFTNPNIKTNAWIFDFNLVNQTALTSKKGTNLGVVQGKAVYAVGNNAEYYLALAANTDTFQNNETIWQQVLDSLKIDQ